jgi:hypothetical protein
MRRAPPSKKSQFGAELMQNGTMAWHSRHILTCKWQILEQVIPKSIKESRQVALPAQGGSQVEPGEEGR